MEEWKNIKGFENLYQVSNYGRVRSIDRIIKRVKDGVLIDFRFKGKLLTPKLNKKTGYAHVALSINSKRKYVNIHRLVAESFIENPDNKPCVNHKDESKLNNNVDNLEWCNYVYNNGYGTKKKRLAESLTGKKRPYQNVPILCFDYNTDKFIKKFPAIYAAVKELKVPQGSIIRVLSGKRKSTHGYYFEYETVKEE